jgi:general nucleoside transport system ATP-binding protein
MIDISFVEPETVLRLDDISKRFGTLAANAHISLSLHRGEILGLLGENGAGKTTLMNILFGHYVADAGEITVNGKRLPSGSPAAALAAGIGMVHQHFTLAENMSVLENIVLGTERLFSLSTHRKAAQTRIAHLAENYGLAVDPDALVSSLSVGERQRVEILKALYRNVRILILDEPTAVLTPQESTALFETLQRFAAQGLSIILISHKLGEVLSACSRVVVLRAGRSVAECQSADVSQQELADLMVGRSVPALERVMSKRGPVVVSLQDVSARLQSRAIANINLDLHGGEIMGIAGVAANGQNIIASLLSGQIKPSRGQVMLKGKRLKSFSPARMIANGVGRIPEDRNTEGLIGDMTVTENAIAESYRTWRMSAAGFIKWVKARDFARDIITNYDVRCPSPEIHVRLLSGGNMQKLLLGRVLSANPDVILANQPTRGLDVGAVSYVHQQLLHARWGGAGILLISEDLDEILALSDRISVMYRGELSLPLPRAEASMQDIGMMMAGQGFSHAA